VTPAHSDLTMSIATGAPVESEGVSYYLYGRVVDDVDEPCRKQLLRDASIDTKNKWRLNLGVLALAVRGPATTVPGSAATPYNVRRNGRVRN
jgi:hypothetical protein